MKIETATRLTPAVKLLRLRWPEGYAPEFKTGQFVMLSWPEAPAERRAYSLVSCALEQGYFDVAVDRVGGMGTRLVDEAEAGMTLLVKPPNGIFVPSFETGRPHVLLAGGAGVTPFRAFVREAAWRKLPTPVTLLYSVREPGDILFRDEFEALAREHAPFQFHATCTRLEPGHPWPGRRGRLDDAWIRERCPEAAAAVFYLCGSRELVEDFEKLLRETLQIPKGQVKTEKW